MTDFQLLALPWDASAKPTRLGLAIGALAHSILHAAARSEVLDHSFSIWPIVIIALGLSMLFETSS